MGIASKPNKGRNLLSFSQKLFLSVISLFIVFAACFIAYQYQREKEYKIELLDMQLQDYNERLHLELQNIPDSLRAPALNSYITRYVNKDIRVTVIDLQGEVTYDNYPNKHSKLGNHIGRPEIQKAL